MTKYPKKKEKGEAFNCILILHLKISFSLFFISTSLIIINDCDVLRKLDYNFLSECECNNEEQYNNGHVITPDKTPIGNIA